MQGKHPFLQNLALPLFFAFGSSFGKLAGFDPTIITPLTQKGLRKRDTATHEATIQPEDLSEARA